MASKDAPEASTARPANEARQAGVLVLGKAVTTLAEGLTPFLVVRLLTKPDVGLLWSLLLICQTTAVLCTAGLAPSLLYFLADRPRAERRRVVARVTRLALGLSALAGCLLAGGAQLARELAPGIADGQVLHTLRWFALYALLDLPPRLLPNLLIAEQRPRAAAAYGLGRALGLALAITVPAWLTGDVQIVLRCLLGYGALQLFAGALLLRWLYRGTSPAPAADAPTKTILRFALPLGATDIVNNLNAAVDRYIIMFFMGAAAFADYQMGAWQIPVVTSTAYSVGHVYMPRFKRLLADGQGAEVLTLWRRAACKVSLIVVPVCLSLVAGAHPFVRLALTDRYLAAVPVLQLYSLYTMGRVTAFGALLLAAGRPGDVLRASGWTFATNLVLSVALYGLLGFVGPALATVFVYIGTVCYYCYFISNATRQPFSRTFPLLGYLRVVAAALPGAAAGYALQARLPTPALSLAAAALSTVLGFATLGTLTRTITSEDWRFASDWLRMRALFK